MRHELLAPAGSYPVFQAVLAAGADAVYLGGDRYSARASAPNFTSDEVLAAIDLAHLYGRKVFLAVNTLLKGKEMGSGLYDYLKPFYERGLDAIIVQDFGVFSFVKKYFPDLPIHVSTQMSVASAYGAEFLKNMGAKRIVTARELSLSDIRDIYEKTGMELECFIHGALCYCYSGDCLMSSLIGGRSGNRGRCAQPCRLPYKVVDGDGREYQDRGRYPLSLKDLCAIELMPKLCEAGVFSFKIEGRMKSLEYAAGVTAIYRKYLDMYESDPSEFSVDKKDMDKLMALGNRGGFTRGYYEEWSGRNMITPESSAHNSPESDEKNQWELPPIYIEGKIKMLSGEPMELTVYPASDSTSQMPFVCDSHANLSSAKDNEVKLISSDSGEVKRRSITAVGPTVQKAKSRPLKVTDVADRIKKTGDTHFVFAQLEADAGEDCFVPVGKINELKRDALCQMRDSMLHCFVRKAPEDYGTVADIHAGHTSGSSLKTRGKTYHRENPTPFLNAVVSNPVQFEAALSSPAVNMVSLDMGANDRVYFDKGIYQEKHFLNDTEEARERIAASGKQTGFCFPYVFGREPLGIFDNSVSDELFARFDVLWVRSYDSLGYCLSHFSGKEEHIRLDGSAYVFSYETYRDFAKLGIGGYTASAELNAGELSYMPNSEAEFSLYGSQPVMITANCLHKNFFACQKGSDFPRDFYISDRTGRKFYVKRCCRDGVNIIYNSRPLYLLHRAEEIARLGFGSYRITFTGESADEANILLKDYERAFIMGENLPAPYDKESFTGGHFLRGVM